MESSSISSNNATAKSNSGHNEYKPKFTKQKEWQNTGTPDGEIKVFYPTTEEFANFSQYVQNIERQNTHLNSGICKIVPPAGWHPRPTKSPVDYSDIDNFKIEYPVKERIECTSAGCYVKNNQLYRKEMHVKEFRRIALLKQNSTPCKEEDELVDLERYFWRNLLHHEPIYGADTPGSIYDMDVKHFNMNSLGTILDLLKELNVTIKGVNTVFLYFGMWKTLFPWHAEDMDLYSINYLHFGEPKFWYAIPPAAAEKFERLAAQRFPDGLQICKAFLRHKLYIISPSILKQHSIPYGTMVQYPGEFIITFPKGYHMGFNVGYNCAESTNFALERWIDYGKNAVLCYCRKDTVEIDMRPFMEKYRPEEFKEWLDYWYGEQPSASGRKMKKPAMRARKGSQETASSGSSNSAQTSLADSEESITSRLPKSICTKRQKNIYYARKPMQELWANRPVNLFAEKQHNQSRGRMYPHCCVCQYFIAKAICNGGSPVETLPERSRRYVNDQMFHKHQQMDKVLWEIDEDELLSCSNCQMVVHRHCYPESSQNNFKNEHSNEFDQPQQQQWLCQRCSGRNDVLVRSTSCTRCQLRGGAFIETCQNRPGSSDFIHVICALMHSSIRFMEPWDRRAPFSPPPRKLVPSYYCSNAYHDDYSDGQQQLAGQQSPGELQHRRTSSVGSCSEAQDSKAFSDSSFDGHDLQPTVTTTLMSALMPANNNQSAGAAELVSNTSTISSTYVTAVQNSPSTSSARFDDFRSAHNSTNNSLQQQHSAMLTDYPASYQCEVCGNQAEAEDLIRCDECISNDEVGASLRFHVTCAPLADITFERRNFPKCAIAICSFHSSEQMPQVEDPRNLQPGTKVTVYSEEEGITGSGRIQQITEQQVCTVDFLDSSTSNDVVHADIRNCECKWFGCSGSFGDHIPGSLIYVTWVDGLTYQGYYRGKTPKKKFKVKLFEPFINPEGSEIVEIDSSSLFILHDALPEEARQYLRKREST